MFLAAGADVLVYRLSSRQVVDTVRIRREDGDLGSANGWMKGTTFFDRDGPSIVAFEIGRGRLTPDGAKWRATPPPGQTYVGYTLEKDSLVALRSDSSFNAHEGRPVNPMFVEIDLETGKTIREFQPLWEPYQSQFRVVDNRLYVFTEDGLAYAMQLGGGR